MKFSERIRQINDDCEKKCMIYTDWINIIAAEFEKFAEELERKVGNE